MFAHLRHIGIVTDNLGKSLWFYRDILGLEIKTEDMENGNFIDKILGLKQSSLKTVKVADKKGGIVELLYYENPRGKKIKREINDLGLSHFALTVENLDETCLKLKENKIDFISTPTLSPNGKAKVCFCYDPNGVAIELVEQLK